MKRKPWLITLVIAMLACMALFVTACKTKDNGKDDGDNNTTEVTISLDKSSLQLEEWQSATLTATKTGTAQTVIWTSSDDEIASVNEVGVVHANKKGDATITASVAGKSATCAVTVTESGVQPTLTLTNIIDGELQIGSEPDGAFTVTAEVTWDGEALDGAKFTWTSDDENIATVEPIGDGYSAVITGIKKGSTTIRVTAQIRSKTAVQTFPVTVTASGIILSFGNEEYEASEEGYSAKLIAVDGGSGSTTTTPTVNAQKSNGTSVPVALTWRLSSGDDVVDLNETTGKITAKKYGTAVVVGTYYSEEFQEEYTITLNVEVERLKVPISHSGIIAINRASTAPVIDLAADELNAELFVNDVKVQSDFTAIAAQKATLSVKAFDVKDSEGLSNKREKISVRLDTDFRSYVFEAQVVDYLIGTADELNAIYSPAPIKSANPSAAAADNTGTFYGNNIIMLDNDIVATNYSGNIGFVDEFDFNGVLDGQGHTIYGLRAGWNGLFQSFGANAVIKNIAFVGLTFTNTPVIFANRMYGTVENCYFEGGNSVVTAGTGFANLTQSSTVIKNVVVNMHDRSGAADGYAVVKTAYGYKEISGLYVVNTDSNGVLNNPTTSSVDLSEADVHYYSSVTAFKNNVASLPAGFSSDDWTMYDGYLIFKSVVSDNGPILGKIEEKLEAIETSFTVSAISFVYINQETTLQASLNDVVWSIAGIGNNDYTLVGNVLTVNENTNLIGTKITITATYTDKTVGKVFTKAISNVEIKKEEQSKTLADQTVGLNRDVTVTLDNTDAVTAVYINNVLIDADDYSLTGTTLTFPKATGKVLKGVTVPGTSAPVESFSHWGKGAFVGKQGEEILVQIETESLTYKFNARVVDWLIGSEAEWQAIWVKDMTVGILDSSYTIILEKDLDLTKYSTPAFALGGEFNGTIDGQNHTITGLQACWTGLFYALGSEGVIKDIAFKGLKFQNGGSAIFGSYVDGKVQNCYFEGSEGKSGSYGFANSVGKGAVIENVVVYVHDRASGVGTGQKSAAFGYYHADGKSGLPTITGLYVIHDDYNGQACLEATSADKINHYASLAAFKSSVTSRPDAISETFWGYLQSMS